MLIAAVQNLYFLYKKTPGKIFMKFPFSKFGKKASCLRHLWVLNFSHFWYGGLMKKWNWKLPVTQKGGWLELVSAFVIVKNSVLHLYNATIKITKHEWTPLVRVCDFAAKSKLFLEKLKNKILQNFDFEDATALMKAHLPTFTTSDVFRAEPRCIRGGRELIRLI